MRNIGLFVFTFIIFTTTVHAQFAVIQDKDGYTNLRKDTTTKSEIVGKVYDYQVFYAYAPRAHDLTFEPSKDWRHVLYGLKIDKDGYSKQQYAFMHKSRIKYISDFEEVSNKKVEKKKMTVENEDKSITIIAEFDDIDTTINKITYFEGTSAINKINGKHPWALYYEKYKSDLGCITNVKATIDDNEVLLPKSAFDDLFKPFYTLSANYDKKTDTLYIKMFNAASGGNNYYVVWVIHKGQYHSRFVGQIY